MKKYLIIITLFLTAIPTFASAANFGKVKVEFITLDDKTFRMPKVWMNATGPNNGLQRYTISGEGGGNPGYLRTFINQVEFDPWAP